MKVISMQDTNQLTTTKKTKAPTSETPLDGAIQESEDTFNYYRDEMDE